MTEDEFKEIMLGRIREAKSKINKETEENIKKTFKVKEIKRLKNENEKSNSKLIFGVASFALATATFILLVLDSRGLPKDEIISKIYSILRIGIATLDVHILGILLKEIIKKCKIKGIIEYLENVDTRNSSEIDLDEQIEEEMKGR